MPWVPALPRENIRSADRDRLEWRVAGVTLFTLLTGFGAHLAIPLPPDGVPMTLQTLAVVLAAMCLGTGLGIASMGLYLLVGALGAGWFAGGNAGFAVLFGQTGGYLLGFVLCQPVVFRIIRRRDGSVRGWGAVALGCLAGHAVIFAVGVPWLAAVRDFPLSRAIEGGLLPFLPGLAVKTVLAVLIARWAVPWAARRIW